jgi:hypothetical protein
MREHGFVLDTAWSTNTVAVVKYNYFLQWHYDYTYNDLTYNDNMYNT